VSLDGLTLLFSSERPGGVGKRDLYLATRASAGADFVLVRNLTELNSGAIDHTASLTADGLSVYFGTGREGGGEDVYRATRAAPGDAFGAPGKVVELSTGAFESSVFIAPDGLSVYFMSNRAGGEGCTDLWMATRASAAAPFSAPTPMSELSSSGCEDDPSLSADGCEIFFSSDVAGNGYEIYRATRSP
jgi:Tol biopolymer transport system component